MQVKHSFVRYSVSLMEVMVHVVFDFLVLKGQVENIASDDAATATVERNNPPNKILFCTNLPNETTKQMLSILFSPYPGLKDIRRVPDRPDIAFIEFESEGRAIVARTALSDFKITPSQAIHVDYANK
uniref:RRM domain-containing protein n=1 Tax=Parascaris univalens TaxID=6257 RepID=A0A915A5Q1_PARUN